MENIYLYDEAAGVHGPYTERDIMNASRRKERMTATHFCSDLNPEWLPMSHFQYVLEPPQSLESRKKLGFRTVRFVAKHNGQDCPVCLALDGQDFPIDNPPTLPPENCSCYPWCGAVLIVTNTP